MSEQEAIAYLTWRTYFSWFDHCRLRLKDQGSAERARCLEHVTPDGGRCRIRDLLLQSSEAEYIKNSLIRDDESTSRRAFF